ncbi:MAG: hypothetical protein M1814_002175 [Vezdaea aestivalis]|nr:MAG: hypothetical protein M1814_002175 [Vezdaea aestivalis]
MREAFIGAPSRASAAQLANRKIKQTKPKRSFASQSNQTSTFGSQIVNEAVPFKQAPPSFFDSTASSFTFGQATSSSSQGFSFASDLPTSFNNPFQNQQQTFAPAFEQPFAPPKFSKPFEIFAQSQPEAPSFSPSPIFNFAPPAKLQPSPIFTFGQTPTPASSQEPDDAAFSMSIDSESIIAKPPSPPPDPPLIFSFSSATEPEKSPPPSLLPDISFGKPPSPAPPASPVETAPSSEKMSSNSFNHWSNQVDEEETAPIGAAPSWWFPEGGTGQQLGLPTEPSANLGFQSSTPAPVTAPSPPPMPTATPTVAESYDVWRVHFPHDFLVCLGTELSMVTTRDVAPAKTSVLKRTFSEALDLAADSPTMRKSARLASPSSPSPPFPNKFTNLVWGSDVSEASPTSVTQQRVVANTAGAEEMLGSRPENEETATATTKAAAATISDPPAVGALSTTIVESAPECANAQVEAYTDEEVVSEALQEALALHQSSTSDAGLNAFISNIAYDPPSTSLTSDEMKQHFLGVEVQALKWQFSAHLLAGSVNDDGADLWAHYLQMLRLVQKKYGISAPVQPELVPAQSQPATVSAVDATSTQWDEVVELQTTVSPAEVSIVDSALPLDALAPPIQQTSTTTEADEAQEPVWPLQTVATSSGQDGLGSSMHRQVQPSAEDQSLAPSSSTIEQNPELATPTGQIANMPRAPWVATEQLSPIMPLGSEGRINVLSSSAPVTPVTSTSVNVQSLQTEQDREEPEMSAQTGEERREDMRQPKRSQSSSIMTRQAMNLRRQSKRFARIESRATKHLEAVALQVERHGEGKLATKERVAQLFGTASHAVLTSKSSLPEPMEVEDSLVVDDSSQVVGPAAEPEDPHSGVSMDLDSSNDPSNEGRDMEPAGEEMEVSEEDDPIPMSDLSQDEGMEENQRMVTSSSSSQGEDSPMTDTFAPSPMPQIPSGIGQSSVLSATNSPLPASGAFTTGPPPGPFTTPASADRSYQPLLAPVIEPRLLPILTTLTVSPRRSFPATSPLSSLAEQTPPVPKTIKAKKAKGVVFPKRESSESSPESEASVSSASSGSNDLKGRTDPLHEQLREGEEAFWSAKAIHCVQETADQTTTNQDSRVELGPLGTLAIYRGPRGRTRSGHRYLRLVFQAYGASVPSLDAMVASHSNWTIDDDGSVTGQVEGQAEGATPPPNEEVRFYFGYQQGRRRGFLARVQDYSF